MGKRRKRIRGAGSVYQRKSDGRWVGSFKTEEMSKRKYVYAPVDDNTEKAAYELLQQAIKEQKEGISSTGKNQKLKDYLAWWLENVHKAKIELGTQLRYQNTLDVHIVPDLGSIPLGKLTAVKLQEFYNKKLETLAPSSVHIMHSILHRALKKAVQYRYLTYNPADGVELPPNEAQREGVSLTLEQIEQLTKFIKGHKLEAFIILLYTAGLRCGEALDLTWDDIHWDTETITIDSRVSYYPKHHFVEGDPKTKKGNRTVPLFDIARDALEAHRNKQDEIKAKAGDSWKEMSLVFCTGKGTFLQNSHIRVDFYKLLDEVGIPRIRIHDLRHTASTFWKSLGISDIVRQEWLGHADAETTGDYTHVLPSMQVAEVKKVNDWFRNRRRS